MTAKWYQRPYRGPLWIWAITVVAIYAALITLIEYKKNSGPAATISVEVITADQNSPQQ